MEEIENKQSENEKRKIRMKKELEPAPAEGSVESIVPLVNRVTFRHSKHMLCVNVYASFDHIPTK
jgi:hypothetical protein